jgi:hypothetical protein
MRHNERRRPRLGQRNVGDSLHGRPPGGRGTVYRQQVDGAAGHLHQAKRLDAAGVPSDTCCGLAAPRWRGLRRNGPTAQPNECTTPPRWQLAGLSQGCLAPCLALQWPQCPIPKSISALPLRFENGHQSTKSALAPPSAREPT